MRVVRLWGSVQGSLLKSTLQLRPHTPRRNVAKHCFPKKLVEDAFLEKAFREAGHGVCSLGRRRLVRGGALT